MRFPLLEHVALPVTFVRYVPGKPHPDGRRYLPLLVFQLASGLQLGVTDRHHYVDPELAGRSGLARLVLLLGKIELQAAGAQRTGIFALPDEHSAIVSAPEAYGGVVAVPSWERRREHLPYDSLYAEILLDVGDGIVGVRTSMTAADLAANVGATQVQPGDWLHVVRAPRIDVLDFVPAGAVDQARA